VAGSHGVLRGSAMLRNGKFREDPVSQRAFCPHSRTSRRRRIDSKVIDGEHYHILKEHGISEVEAIIPDLAGVARASSARLEIRGGEGSACPRRSSCKRHRRLSGRPERTNEPFGYRHRAGAPIPRPSLSVALAAEPTARLIPDCY